MNIRKTPPTDQPGFQGVTPTPGAPNEQVEHAPFPIVGLGASAGGLEAYEAFFRQVPPDSGMAFVLVSHLDPTQDSILSEILQRTTSLPVTEVEDRTVVAPDHVYVIPPNRDLSIFHGVLQLSLPQAPRGQRMPIDTFLRSLAEDQGERAIGIIFSGTGSDGTLGLRAILGAGGISLVQEPGTAKYDAMPASAIRAGFASHVLPVEDMPALLVAGARSARSAESAPLPAGSMAKLLMLVRSATGHDFSLYKKSTIGRRIERRMSQHHIKDIDVYTRFLKENRAEIKTLFRDLLINVTRFFRDPEAFAFLGKVVLPKLLADQPVGYVFRAWVAGCASGEEAYSLAILLREYMDETHQEFKVQIFATDLDDEAIAQARAAFYLPNIAADVTPERLRRYFTQEDGGYRVKKQFREMVVFANHSVIKNPPFTKLDLLSCRNLMIYLEPELQQRLISAFHYALKPHGVLFLSPSESLGSHTERFTVLNQKWRLYGAVHSAGSIRAIMAGGLPWSIDMHANVQENVTNQPMDLNLSELTRRALLRAYAPASVVANANGVILHVHGETGKYLRPAPGQAAFNLVDMAREELQLDLRTALQVAANQGTATLAREVKIKTDSGISTVSLSVRPLSDGETSQKLLLVSFQDVAQKRRRRATGSGNAERIEELERDLAYARENLHALFDEHQANSEEYQSTNEELQSANEELGTSQEEMQSINEELITVNEEMHAKIELLGDLQNDMKNLFDNINLGVLFLDQHLIIRRFTPEMTQIYRLAASDVGRPLADIKSGLKHDDLTEAAQRVLDSLVPSEYEVRVVGGASYLVRIRPYRTLENMIAGIVLTFTDISQRIKAEVAELKARKLAESIVNTVRDPLLVLDENMQVVTASRSFFRRFQTMPDETLGRSLFDLDNRQWDIPELRELLEKILPRDQLFDGFPVTLVHLTLGRCNLLLNGRRIVVEAGEAPLILLAIEDAGHD